MKTIPLTRGRVALVDDADFEILSKHSWCCQGDGYPVTNVGKRPNRHTVLMLFTLQPGDNEKDV